MAEIKEKYIVGGVVIKHYKKFDEQNRLIVHERYNVHDSLQARFVFTYNSNETKKSSGKYMTKTEFESIEYVTERYQYDSSGFLTSVIRLNLLKDTLSILKVISNQRGEILRVNEYSKDGTMINSDPPLQGVINLNKKTEPYEVFSIVADKEESKSKWRYNKNNDLIKTSDTINKWKYDDHGNWIEVKIFNIDRGQRVLSLEQHRTILYR